MIEIRKATSFDAHAIMEFLKKVGAETDNLSFGGEGIGIPLEGIKSFITNSKCYYIALDGNKIIGSTQLSPGRRRFAHTSEFAISVLKDYWGKGIAQKLFDKSLLWAKENGVRKINLEVRDDNLRAIRFYERNGFVKEGMMLRMLLINDTFIDGIRYGLLID